MSRRETTKAEDIQPTGKERPVQEVSGEVATFLGSQIRNQQVAGSIPAGGSLDFS